MNDGESINYFGETNFRNQQTRFGIKNRDRTRHMYVVGKSGVGKSTLLENMAIQDIQNGEGVAVLDPHGSFAEKMLDYIPEHRIKDVIYFAPFDTEHPMSFNVLEDVGADKRHLVVSGLMSTFKKIWVDAWSARMEYILSNTLLALLEYPGSTLLGVNRMLSDKDFRKKVVDNISDSAVKAFWTEEFAKYTERMAAEAVPAIQNKIGQLTANPLIRNIIGQPKSSFDIREVMDNKKILIINLSKGRIGDQNTSLLGSMIITKIYLAAMSRANVSHSRMGDLPAFYFYVDEFQSFANESFADILSEARKYKLALIIAHQYIAQMDESVRDAVFGNVGTSISFRVGPLDAEVLEKVYSPQFVATDLVNLGMAQIYLSLMINDIGSQPFSAKTLFPIARPPITYRNDVIEWTRLKFALPRATVEQNIRDWFGPAPTPYVPSEAPKKYVPKDNSKPYIPVSNPVIENTQNPQNNPVPQTVPSQTFVKKEYEKKPYVEKPKEHNPFKKALENIPIIEQPISEEMNILLDKIDSSVKTESIIKKEINPFVGEKTLRETITPVKFAERGATLQNRNLLKEALMKATGSKSEVLENPPEIKKEPTTSSPEVKEISHSELLKVLE
jgi:Type IV secretion-system coupling protein DNA-binding domain